MDQLPSKFPTFQRIGAAAMHRLCKLPWRRVGRRIGRGALAFFSLWLILAVALSMYGRAADRKWVAWRAQAATKGLMLDIPPADSSSLPDSENLAAPGGPFATISIDPASDASERRDWLGDLSWAPIGALPDVAKGVRVDFNKAVGWQPRRNPADGASAQTRPIPTGAAEFLAVFDQWIGPEWAKVRDAERKPKTSYRLPLDPRPTRKIPFLTFRKAAQLHAIRSLALLAMNRSSDALEEIRGGLRLARALEESSGSALTSSMLRIAMIHLLSAPVWEGLADDRWSDADLAALGAEFDAVRPASQWSRMWDADAAFSTASLEATLKQPAWERIGDLRKDLFKRNGPNWGNVEMDLAFFSKGLIRENQIAICERLLLAKSLIDADGQLRPSDLPAVGFDQLTGSQRHRYCVAFAMSPNIERAAQRVAMVESRVRHARIAIALERFRREHGVLPETLGALTPALLRAVPVDPIDGKPMRYARKDDGGYRLWSIGADQVDDGGIPAAQEDPSAKFDVVWEGFPHDLATEGPKTAAR